MAKIPESLTRIGR